MLLTPEHFRRQEQYFDSSLLWMMRYVTNAYGLVGAGARREASERGAAKYDPLLNISDDGETIKVSVLQCRGISPSGDIIEIEPTRALHASFPKTQFERVLELGIYVVCTPHDKVVEEGIEDSANPLSKAVRRQQYRIQLDVNAAEAAHSIMIGRLKRLMGTLRFEKVAGLIPVCTTLIGHSELKRAWDGLREELVELAGRFTELHKAIVEYISIFREKQINVAGDDETLQFVGRMVVSLENGVFDILNPLQTPQQFFQQMYRLIRSAAIYLDLSPPTCDYFRQLAEAGDREFDLLLEKERQTLLTNREWTIHDNLEVDVRRIEQAIIRLRRLEEGLEGKYVDYRLSKVLEALTFFYDRRSDPPALFQTIHKPSRPQISRDELTFVFAPLSLEGRQSYRVVLICDSDEAIPMGKKIDAEIHINKGTGQGFDPIFKKTACEIPDQRNFALDFEVPPNVPSINDVRVIVNADSAIRSCLLYMRRRAIQARMTPHVSAAAQSSSTPERPTVGGDSGSTRMTTETEAPKPERRASRLTDAGSQGTQGAEYEDERPSRSSRLSRVEEPPDDPDEPPVRRRRLF